MELKIVYRLKTEEISDTMRNIESSSNNLVQKVLAEETTFVGECRKLGSYDKEEFYQKRDELADALNHYRFGEIIEEKEKMVLDYKLFCTELNALKKRRNKIKGANYGGWGSGAGGVSLTVLGLISGMLPVSLIGLITICVGGGVGLCAVDRLEKLDDDPGKGFMTINKYLVLEKKSEEADEFMYDFKCLKENTDDILSLYREDPKTDKDTEYIN
ncbi:MAG: hypothetical protein ISS23_01380 [Nanoarchaeota archaeon]|nr:hypothetical protein [Nanoarchaeota archaeon]